MATSETVARLDETEQVGHPAVRGAAVGVLPAVEPRLVAVEVAGGDEESRVEPRREPLDHVERDVRDRDVRVRQRRPRARRRRAPSTSTPFTRAFAFVASIAASSRSTPITGANPSLAAPIERTPDPQPMSSSDPGSTLCSSSRLSRVVGCAPGAEGAAGIDDDRLELRRRLLPRRPDPEAADRDTVVELPPRVLPTLADVVGLEDVEADRRLVGVDREGAVELLHALREEMEQEHELRLAADDDVPLQRNALFSFSKKPSSDLYVCSSTCESNSARRRRWSSVSRRGTRTLTSTRWSPRP